MEIIISWALGALTAILISIFVEGLRKPRLEIEIVAPVKAKYPGDPAKTHLLYAKKMDHPASDASYLTVSVKNKQLPKWAKWMSRNAALQCEAKISFHHLDGQEIFSSQMQGRWVESPEPLPLFAEIGGEKVEIIDPNSLNLYPTMTIYPGQSRNLDIAAKFDNDSECFGWTNENYFSQPLWRNPKWKLPSGRYLIYIHITSDSMTTGTTFRLLNEATENDFRLEDSHPNDQAIFSR